MTTPYDVVGQDASFAGLCEKWVELQVVGHSGVYANPMAASRAADFVRIADAARIPAGVAVVFAAAPSNEQQGHTGVSVGAGRMRSVWSDGQIVVESIDQFARDNGAPLLGWHNFGRGATGSAAGAATAAAAPPRGVPTDVRRIALLAVAAGLAYAAIDWALG